MTIILILMIFLLLAALMLFVFAPSGGRKRADNWRGTAFAHRGLHNEQFSENSVQAFERACSLGFGIELDVQLTRDGVPVVFHDDNLKRMLGDERRVDEVDYTEFADMPLPDGSTVPRFEDVLKLVNGRVPLLVELKNGRSNDRLCADVCALLRAYRGPYIMESFSPLIVRWFRKNAPEIIRGQLVCAMDGYMPAFGKSVAMLLSSLALNFLARPDFVAYDIAADFASPGLQRRIFRTPLACWTVKTAEQYEQALHRGEMPIFEGFVPEQKQ